MLAAAQSIQRATSRMAEMLRDLLDLSTIEQGRYVVDLAPRKVEDLFEDSTALLLPIAEAKRIALTFRCEPGLVVGADGERLYQVISNLVGNALKFTRGGGLVAVSAEPDPGSQGSLVRFAVADNGSGMPAEQLGHIFERYWHVRDANPTGSGLGLYIASGIVQAHGGTIWAESELGVGSRFYFTLRRA
jgi:chemotaxis family two-component system sensor kinase Cph1